VLGEVGVAGVVEGGGERPGEPDALVELADAALRSRPGRCFQWSFRLPV
jgi:hypothetical protein